MTDTATKIELLMNGLIAPVQPAWIDEAIALLPQAKTEIERLRSMYQVSDSENDELRAENDRLLAALGSAREFVAGLMKPVAPGIHTISSYHPCQALIDKIDSATGSQQEKP